MRTILVTGATGKQGGATIRALLSQDEQEKSPFNVVGVTRNPESASAKALAAMPGVSMIKGDLDDCAAIFRKVDTVWGVFSVQLPSNTDHAAEARQGKALFDAAVAHNVTHFVYASVDRGGPERSNRDPTPVPHFETKYTIEKYIQERAPANHMSWTFVRPAAFFENLTPDFMGKVFATVWKTMPRDTKLQLVSTKDIGLCAARAFRQSQDPAYHNNAISLAGDELTFGEAARIFERTQGRTMPTTFTLLARFIRLAISAVGKMFKWFEEVGYGVDIAELRVQYPQLQDFSTWLTVSSGFAVKK